MKDLHVYTLAGIHARVSKIDALTSGEVDAVARVIHEAVETGLEKTAPHMDGDVLASLLPDEALDLAVAVVAPIADSVTTSPHSGIDLDAAINILIALRERLNP
ncbi:hypothetical protein OHS70_34365 [Streptomyces sp. NBC_00390]|uniref:hypothetical protein n=1 Tax=Streptomyces sp. NBC_00390 TaxID=2975736 RepID=UPI002E1D1629